MSQRRILRLRINGQQRELLVAPERTLLELLREDCDLPGSKFGCELGECGACTVLLNGEPTLACSTLACLCDGAEIVTVEGLDDSLAAAVAGALEECGGSQCGYCTPGMAVIFHHLLERGGVENVEAELSGNLCRCTGYLGIRNAFESAKAAHGAADE